MAEVIWPFPAEGAHVGQNSLILLGISTCNIDASFCNAGTPSSVQPAIPSGPVEVGVDYPGNDIVPCNVGGCILPANATIMDCKRKCTQASLCVGYVFAPGNCSSAGPKCYTKSSLQNRTPNPGCRYSQAVGYKGDNGTGAP